MPAKNTIKQYVEDSFYHIYNRGVDKRTIFEDSIDYKTFLSYLKFYLSPPPDPTKQLQSITFRGVSFKGIPTQLKNYHQEIRLVSYCLMPNHFHLFIKQKSKQSIENFMRSLATRYVIHFNKRHDRLGHLFQDTYKATLIDSEPYLLHLTRYIHQNPAEFWNKSLRDYPYSSYAEYLGLRKTDWVKPKEILDFFRSRRNLSKKDYLSYQSFVESTQEDSAITLQELTLE